MPEHLVADFDYAATDGALYIVGDAKLNVCCTREGAGVNGTYVTTHVGAGSMYLRDVLAAAGTGHRQVPIVYGTLGSYSAVVGISNVVLELRDETGAIINGLSQVRLGRTRESAKLCARAEAEVDAYARAGWERRYEHVQYPHARTLTKTVARVPVGLNDSGYTIVPYVVDQVFPFGAKVLNGLLERAIGIETRPAEGNGRCCSPTTRSASCSGRRSKPSSRRRANPASRRRSRRPSWPPPSPTLPTSSCPTAPTAARCCGRWAPTLTRSRAGCGRRRGAGTRPTTAMARRCSPCR